MSSEQKKATKPTDDKKKRDVKPKDKKDDKKKDKKDKKDVKPKEEKKKDSKAKDKKAAPKKPKESKDKAAKGKPKDTKGKPKTTKTKDTKSKKDAVSKKKKLEAAAKAVKGAKVASKAVKKGILVRKSKIRTSVHFYRPKTLRLQRNPKYERASTVRRNKMDKFRIIKFPLCSESAMKQIEDNNTLTFVVDLQANKRQIKQAIKQLYEIDVVRVNTLIRPDGQKKAYVRLNPDQEALEVANTIGII